MSTFFISGHRDITIKEFQRQYAKDIMNAVLRDPKSKFVVGDYFGVDEMAQAYLHSLKQKYTELEVIVYHMFEEPRNNEYGFPTKGGYVNDHDRDSAMTMESDSDIAWVRSGKWNSGTAQNLLRRKVQRLMMDMRFKDANEFAQGLIVMLKDHPKNKTGVAPTVHYSQETDNT